MTRPTPKAFADLLQNAVHTFQEANRLASHLRRTTQDQCQHRG